MMDNPIAASFLPLIALPCWGADKVQGSILSFEFGEPRLIVREPMTSRSESPRVRAKMARRNVKPVGAWNLTIFVCHWLISGGEAKANDEADDEAIRAAVRELDGQKLMGVTLDARQRRTTFYFDLGETLATWPYEVDREEQWSLYMPDHRVLSYRADGRYSLGASTLEPGEEAWQPLPREPQTYCIGSPTTSSQLS
jgi:hypothetical protein